MVGSGRCDSGADGLDVTGRIALGANQELRVGEHHGGVWNVNGGGDRAINAVVARIADDADDLTRGGALRRGDLIVILRRETGNAYLSAQGIGRGEIARRESAIDYRDEVSARVFILIPDAPVKQRNAERIEISLADQHHTGLQLFAIASSVKDEGVFCASVRRRGIHADGDRGDTGDGCDLLPDLLDVSGAPFA